MSEKVKCMICGEEFDKMISGSHLKRKHWISTQEYKEKYPDAEIISDEHRAQLKHMQVLSAKARMETKRLRGEEKAKEEIVNKDIIIDTAPVIIPAELKSSEWTHLVDDIFIPNKDASNSIIKEKVLYINPRENTSIDKLQILNYLDGRFPNRAVENNYVAEKRSFTGEMHYRILTDMSIPSLKLDFEFPKSWWHNTEGEYYDRNVFLTHEGWKIIFIDSRDPKISDIEEKLKNLNII